MIIGITGTDGSGKGAAVDHLIKKEGFSHYSSRSLISKEVEARGLPLNRDQMRLVANDMRSKQGLDFIVKSALSKIDSEGVGKAVIESIRTIKEAETLRANGGVLLAIDASLVVRYRRITGRKSASDSVSFEKFVAHEKIEMNDPDPSGMQKRAVMESADYTILNNGSMREFRENINKFLESTHD